MLCDFRPLLLVSLRGWSASRIYLVGQILSGRRCCGGGEIVHSGTCLSWWSKVHFRLEAGAGEISFPEGGRGVLILGSLAGAGISENVRDRLKD